MTALFYSLTYFAIGACLAGFLAGKWKLDMDDEGPWVSGAIVLLWPPFLVGAALFYPARFFFRMGSK